MKKNQTVAQFDFAAELSTKRGIELVGSLFVDAYTKAETAAQRCGVTLTPDVKAVLTETIYETCKILKNAQPV